MKTIVVGIDGTETAMKAAEMAAELAIGMGATLHVVSAVPHKAPKRTADGKVALTTLDQAEAALADVVSRLNERVPNITTAAVSGKPVSVLVDEATRVDADVIVVGNRRVQSPARLLGAIAEDVAYHAPCSVYIAKTT